MPKFFDTTAERRQAPRTKLVEIAYIGMGPENGGLVLDVSDGGLLVASDKTSTDHLISMVSKQDCALWRVIKGRAVCKPREGDKDPYKVDYDDPQRKHRQLAHPRPSDRITA